MGLVLQQTALSVNVKQRRDFSCAVFDQHGHMLASAPHVPVHLGAMGATVRAAIAQYPDMRPGDVIVTNNPYAGGSHLPDVTVITVCLMTSRTLCLRGSVSRRDTATCRRMTEASVSRRGTVTWGRGYL